jgi:hypothetical protein
MKIKLGVFTLHRVSLHNQTYMPHPRSFTRQPFLDTRGWRARLPTTHACIHHAVYRHAHNIISRLATAYSYTPLIFGFIEYMIVCVYCILHITNHCSYNNIIKYIHLFLFTVRTIFELLASYLSISAIPRVVTDSAPLIVMTQLHSPLS